MSNLMPDEKQAVENSKRPISRFWACFFSCSIFALLWTSKMQKTRKWIPMFMLFVGVWFLLDYILYPPIEFSDVTTSQNIRHMIPIEPNPQLESFVGNMLYETFPNNGNLDNATFLISFSLIIIYHLVIFIGCLLLMIHKMLKWTTQYNLDNFGYKSKKEWKRATLPQRQIVKKIKSKSGDLVSGAKSITRKTSDKIPSDKIKDIPSGTAEKITHTIQNLSSKEMTDENKRNQIREWYNLMTLGIITKSDFEQKKAELLK